MDLPFVDEHAIRIEAPRAAVWTAVERYAGGLGVPDGIPLATLLGTEPRAGFEVAERVPQERLLLTGRHRFSRYALEFVLSGDTVLRAVTYAEFPGIRGQAYKTLVIRSRGHVLAVQHMLRSIRRRVVAPPDNGAHGG